MDEVIYDIVKSFLTFWQLGSMGSTGVDLGWVTLTSSLPHSRLAHNSVISALINPKQNYFTSYLWYTISLYYREKI